jgi:hypothetical protein
VHNCDKRSDTVLISSSENRSDSIKQAGFEAQFLSASESCEFFEQPVFAELHLLPTVNVAIWIPPTKSRISSFCAEPNWSLSFGYLLDLSFVVQKSLKAIHTNKGL